MGGFRFSITAPCASTRERQRKKKREKEKERLKRKQKAAKTPEEKNELQRELDEIDKQEKNSQQDKKDLDKQLEEMKNQLEELSRKKEERKKDIEKKIEEEQKKEKEREKEKEKLEREMAAAVPEFARKRTLEQGRHDDLLKILPQGTAVLDLVRFTRFEQDRQVKGQKGERQTPGYVGFVLSKGQPVRMVDLGPAQPIEDAVSRWRQAIVQGQDSDFLGHQRLGRLKPRLARHRRRPYLPQRRQVPVLHREEMIFP